MSQSAVAFSDIASNVIEVHQSTEAVAKKHSELEEELSRLTREVADSVHVQKEGLDASLELVYRLQNQVPVFTELQQSLAGLGADMSRSAASLSGAVANLQELHLSIEQSVTAAREQQAELSLSQEEHRQNLRKELDVMKTFWESSAQELRDLHQELSTGIQTFTNQLHDGLSYSIGEFDNLLTDVTTRLRVVISAMSDSVEDIPDEMNRVVGALHELRGVLERAVAETELRLSGINGEIEQYVKTESEMS